MKKAYIEIDLKRLKENYQYYKKNSDKKIIAVVKDNAYGHGLNGISKALESYGCPFFAVASLKEALILRNNNITGGILILGYLDGQEYDIASKNDISVTIYSCEQLNEITNSLINNKLKVHIKINSGMQRNGILPNQFDEVINTIKNDNRLILEGVFTHYIGGKNSYDFVKNQYDVFCNIVKTLTNDKIMIHASSTNSYNLLDDKISNFVRIGLGLYGLGDEITNPILSLRAPIVQVYYCKSGTLCGYDGAFSCKRDGYTFTIPIGYSDGIKLIYNHTAYLGEYLTQGGKVSMDYSTFFSPIFHEIGEVVELIGDHISVSEIAIKANTNKYDIVCSLSDKLTRKYII
jgi:alanine racemase